MNVNQKKNNFLIHFYRNGEDDERLQKSYMNEKIIYYKS